MNSNKNGEISIEKSSLFNARVAGIFYFTFLITAGFSQLVRNNLIIPNNIAVTVSNIITHNLLYRISFVTDLIGSTSYIFLIFFLYKLLKSVNKNIAKLMVILVLIGIPIAMLNQLNQFAPLLLLSGADYLKVFDTNQINSLIMLFLDFYKHGVYIADIFWGSWLIPFGYLVYKSKFLPRILGILLMAGSSGFLIESFVMTLIPDYQILTYPGLAIGTIAELSTIFWLLIRGINVKIEKN